MNSGILLMKILGLFIVVFVVFALNRFLGFSETATIIGCIVSAVSYILINT